MKALDDLIRNVIPGGAIVVRASALGMSEAAFNRLASEIQDDDGVDDFDFVKVHRLGDTGWQHLDTDTAVERPIDALTLRRWKA
jgi:hypothetical protein